MPRFASLTDRLTLTFGARYTEDERLGGKLTPRAYATYAITDSLTLACGISTGYKTSELRESAANYYSCTGGSCRRAVALGNPNLKPEQCTSYELGVRFDISPAMQCSKVNLPAPLGPINAMMPPWGKVRLISRKISACPARKLNEEIRIMPGPFLARAQGTKAHRGIRPRPPRSIAGASTA